MGEGYILIKSESLELLTNQMIELKQSISELKSTNDRQWYSTYEVCKYLSITNRTLQKWRDKNMIKYSVIIGKHYYNINEVNLLLEQNCVKNT